MATQTSKILSGKPVAAAFEANLKEELARSGSAKTLTLATLQMGDSADMRLYSNSLGKVLQRFGIRHLEKIWMSDAEMKKGLRALTDDPEVTGIMVYSPVPPSIDAKFVFLNLPRTKDVEGRTFVKGNPFGVFSPTAKAVMRLLKSIGGGKESAYPIKGKHAVVVGHSDLVGKPTAVMLLDEGATVTVCHKDTENLEKYVAEADILIVAIGKPGVIRSDWVKPGAVVLDVGENVVNGKVVGDMDAERVLEKVSYISPVPGGVGPLTNLMVIENLIELDKYQKAPNGNR